MLLLLVFKRDLLLKMHFIKKKLDVNICGREPRAEGDGENHRTVPGRTSAPGLCHQMRDAGLSPIFALLAVEWRGQRSSMGPEPPPHTHTQHTAHSFLLESPQCRPQLPPPLCPPPQQSTPPSSCPRPFPQGQFSSSANTHPSQKAARERKIRYFCPVAHTLRY